MAAARPAFAADAARQRARAGLKAAWWIAGRAMGRAVVKPAALETAKAPPKPGAGRRLRDSYFEAFAKDAADVAAGLYPPLEGPPPAPAAAVARLADLIDDARAVEARRQRGDGVEAREEAEGARRPAYYRQNFHFQSGGWFTPDSAARYDGQVELLFAGAAAAMRRRALSLLARAWRDRDQRVLTGADVACGAGSFLADLRRAFPRSAWIGADLSAAYVRRAADASGAAPVQAMAERLPFADGSLDAVTCVYLFHELPPRVRRAVAAEFARVLKPGGYLAFADSVQPADEPELERILLSFPVNFHEPFYESYAAEDLPALFAEAGLTLVDQDRAFLTKALLLQKA